MPEKFKSNGTAEPTLEQRGVAALADDALTSTVLAALVEETRTAIGEAEQLAAHERERAFDPALSADPLAAHAAMENAYFRVGRLKTLLPRLQRRLAEVVKSEEAVAWLAERDEFEAAHLAAMAEQGDAYDEALKTIVSFFAHVEKFSAARGALLSRRPVHLGLENISDPVPAPSLLQNSRLFDLAGRQLWPNPAETNRLAAEMAEATLRMVSSGDRDACTPNWWKAVARRQAAAAAEAELQGKRFVEMKIEQEKRENAEEKERFAAMHGGAVK
jgi:hypothetical protein